MEEKVFFKTSDGLNLCGILSISKQKTDKCIILCHGIGNVDKDEDGIFTQLTKKLTDAEFAIFRFDFRGHGESEGKQIEMTVTGELLDLEAAAEFLRNKRYKNFGILGASFAGGAVSLFTNRNQDCVKGLILWNALIDYQSMINPVTNWEKKHWGRKAFDRAEQIGHAEIGSSKYKMGKALARELLVLKPWRLLKNVNVPILFIHGDKDDHVPFEDSVKYAKMLNAKLITIKGATHGFHEKPEYSKQADRATIDFFKKYL